MAAAILDHVNIVSHDLDASAAFYAAVLGLDPRKGPPPFRLDQSRWLYSGERPVVHLVSPDMAATRFRPAVDVRHTGPLHHVAFECADYPATIARLDSMALKYEIEDIPSFSLRQVFLVDPSGVLLELNFRMA